MNIPVLQYIIDFFTDKGLNSSMVEVAVVALFVALVAVAAWLSDKISNMLLKRVISRAVKRSKTNWDDIMLQEGVFNRLAHLAPAFVIYYAASFINTDLERLIGFVQSATMVYVLLMVLLVADSLMNGLHRIYQQLPMSRGRSIKGYVQLVKIIIYFAVIISVFSILLNKPLYNILTGLGALAAVLMFVFKDTILGFVASIQLAANKMVNVGDWIEMPKYHADGDVIDITLNTVKVQNWDKTIATIPTYALVSDSFINWRGMKESGGRRIKRSVRIDIKSIKFCSPGLIHKLKRINYLKGYIQQKLDELEAYNSENNIDNSVLVNGRRMTNLGVFRKYIEFYLRNHPKIHQDMTFLVRQLQPDDKGIPLEIYVFTNDQVWANYESIQADIFDHVLAVIPEFELQVFQRPSGADVQAMIIAGE